MSTLIIHHDDCLQHDPGPGHPEQIRRLKAVLGGLEGLRKLEYLPAPLVGEEQVERLERRAVGELGQRESRCNRVVSRGVGARCQNQCM